MTRLKRFAGVSFAALMFAGSVAATSTPVSAASDYCKTHKCGGGGSGRPHVTGSGHGGSRHDEGYGHRDAYRHDDGYRHGPGVVPLVGGIVGGILGGAAAAAAGEDCWRHDDWGNPVNVC